MFQISMLSTWWKKLTMLAGRVRDSSPSNQEWYCASPISLSSPSQSWDFPATVWSTRRHVSLPSSAFSGERIKLVRRWVILGRGGFSQRHLERVEGEKKDQANCRSSIGGWRWQSVGATRCQFVRHEQLHSSLVLSPSLSIGCIMGSASALKLPHQISAQHLSHGQLILS